MSPEEAGGGRSRVRRARPRHRRPGAYVHQVDSPVVLALDVVLGWSPAKPACGRRDELVATEAAAGASQSPPERACCAGVILGKGTGRHARRVHLHPCGVRLHRVWTRSVLLWGESRFLKVSLIFNTPLRLFSLVSGVTCGHS